jgi:hypothetical protein
MFCRNSENRDEGNFFRAEAGTAIGVRLISASRHRILEYRRPNRTLTEPIAEAGVKLKFCPWCGINLVERYKSGLEQSRSEI